jgi:hypothetical protein
MLPVMNIETQTAIVLFALVAAFGLVTVLAVDIMLTTQKAEAKGCSLGGHAYNRSNRNCFNPG